MTMEAIKTTLLKDWPSRAILTILTLMVGYVFTQADSIIERKILDTVAPAMDTLTRKVEATDAKVEKVDEKLDALIDVMREAFPEFKKAAQERARENKDSKDIKDALQGDNR